MAAYRTAEIVTRSAHAPDTLQGMNTAIDGLWRRYIDGPAAVIVDFLEQTLMWAAPLPPRSANQ